MPRSLGYRLPANIGIRFPRSSWQSTADAHMLRSTPSAQKGFSKHSGEQAGIAISFAQSLTTGAAVTQESGGRAGSSFLHTIFIIVQYLEVACVDASTLPAIRADCSGGTLVTRHATRFCIPLGFGRGTAGCSRPSVSRPMVRAPCFPSPRRSPRSLPRSTRASAWSSGDPARAAGSRSSAMARSTSATPRGRSPTSRSRPAATPASSTSSLRSRSTAWRCA